MEQSTHLCEVCGTPVAGRSDKRCCSAECKKQLKRQYDRERYSKNSDEVIARACAYQRENREWKQHYDREYRKTRDLKKHAAWNRKRSKENPDYGRMQSQKRYAKKKGNGSFLVTLRDLERLAARHEGLCAYCRGQFTDTNRREWDHVIPISRGGSHSIGNLVPACKSCNRAKSFKTLVEWRAGVFVNKPDTVRRRNAAATLAVL